MSAPPVFPPILTPYSNGQQLSSDAYTPSNMAAIWQPLTCNMLGINPPNFDTVRVDWQTQGQPFQKVQFDHAYLMCVPWETDYNKIRDAVTTQTGTGVDAVLTQTWTYTRGWRVSWVIYGPNSFTNGSRLKSAMYMDFFNDYLDLCSLYIVNDPPDVVRNPEQFNGQWWERADFYIDMYELVTETILPGVVTSVEIKVLDKDGQVADITVQE